MIIDFHTHLFPKEFREARERFFHNEPAFRIIYENPKARLAGVRELLRHMDEEGIERSVVFGFPWEQYDNFRRHNDYILEAVSRYPDRLIGFCCFSPLAVKGAQEADRCISAGLKGVGELAVYSGGMNRPVLDALDEVMAICRQRGVPVLVHTNEPVGHQYPGKVPISVKQIYELIRHFPANRIILAHWGGGLFFYALLKKGVKEELNNVWFDTAASPYLYKETIYRIAGEILGYDKIVFGTDYPLLPASRYYEEINSSGISQEAKKKILGLNAQDILQVPVQQESGP